MGTAPSLWWTLYVGSVQKSCRTVTVPAHTCPCTHFIGHIWPQSKRETSVGAKEHKTLSIQHNSKYNQSHGKDYLSFFLISLTQNKRNTNKIQQCGLYRHDSITLVTPSPAWRLTEGSCSLRSSCLHQPFEYRTTEKIHHRKNPDYCCSLDIFLFFRLVPEWDACVWKSQYILISEIFRPTCSSVTTCFIQNHLNDLSFSFWCSVWTSAGHIGLNTLSYCHVISSWSFSHKKEREKKRKFRWESPQKRRH